MDDDVKKLLVDILNQNEEQTELLRKNLGRLRFSLRALLLLMTVVAVGLGFVAYKMKSATFVAPLAPAANYYAPAVVYPPGTTYVPVTTPSQQFVDPAPEK
jgi:hypothetical protein